MRTDRFARCRVQRRRVVRVDPRDDLRDCERAVAERRENLGFTGYRIVELQVGPRGGPMPRPRSRGMAMMAEAAVAPPALEAGTSAVQVTVSGTLQLK